MNCRVDVAANDQLTLSYQSMEVKLLISSDLEGKSHPNILALTLSIFINLLLLHMLTHRDSVLACPSLIKRCNSMNGPYLILKHTNPPSR
jgi:hypothetical protein